MAETISTSWKRVRHASRLKFNYDYLAPESCQEPEPLPTCPFIQSTISKSLTTYSGQNHSPAIPTGEILSVYVGDRSSPPQRPRPVRCHLGVTSIRVNTQNRKYYSFFSTSVPRVFEMHRNDGVTARFAVTHANELFSRTLYAYCRGTGIRAKRQAYVDDRHVGYRVR